MPSSNAGNIAENSASNHFHNDDVQSVIAWRQELHRHPELAYEEVRTADFVAAKLAEWGIEIHRSIGKTGVVGVLRSGAGTRSIGLRADMDALPLTEANTFAHASRYPGKMHACGHDGHTAMLLGAARLLAHSRQIDGTINFIFQPAEEGTAAGALAMIEDGLFDRFPCDAVFALHNWPGLPTGHFAVRSGPLLASNNSFRIELTGRGSHAAMPQQGTDALLASAHLITALQSILTRNKHPLESAVLSVTEIQGGTASNIIADSVWFSGTVRAFSNETLDLVESRMRSMASAGAEAFGCRASVTFTRNYPATINTPDETAFAIGVMEKLVGRDHVTSNVEPTMGAEDFAFMLQRRPGAYVLLGNGDGDHRAHGHGLGTCMLHSPAYDFNDTLITTGVRFWAELAQQWLARI